MNTITIAEIKRGGFAALDVALHRGAATIMKRNRPAAIVLTPAAYETLLARTIQAPNPGSALDWLLDESREMGQFGVVIQGPAMAERLDDLKRDWPEP